MNNPYGTIHIDKLLTSFSLKFKNGALIADQVAPRVKVEKESDKYVEYGKQDFRKETDIRADGTEARQVTAWSVASNPTYTCEEHALKSLVTQRQLDNADKPIRPEMATTDGLTQKILITREYDTATLFTTAANFATSGNTVDLSGTPTDQFNNSSFVSAGVTTSIEYRIDTGKEAIRAGIGIEPNTVIIPAAVAKVVKRDATMRDLVKHTHSDLLVNGDLPPTLWNMKVVIPGAIYDSANEGQAFSGADIWGKHIVLAYIAPGAAGTDTMTAALTFESQPRRVEKWRESKLKGNMIEVSEIRVEKLVSEYAAYLIENAIA